MWFFTEEEKMVRDSTRDFSQRALRPYAEKADEEESIPDSHFEGLAKLGLLGITAPEKYGGAQMGCVAATIAMEEVAKACASTALSYLAHSILVVHNIAKNANEEQRDCYLPDLITGKKIAGLGITEPNSGSDSLSMSTHAKKKGETYILNGTKMFITNAPQGNIFFCYAKMDVSKRDITSFLIEEEMKGFSKGKTLQKMGMKGSPTGELIFNNCEVPRKNLIGKENGATKNMLNNLNIERIVISGISLGIAASCLDEMLRYACNREQFRQPIAKFQMIQKMIADADAELFAARSMVYTVAKEFDLYPEKHHAASAARAKLISAQTATKIALDAIQVLGGYGYIREFPVERYMRDAKLNEIGAGTNEIMRLILAKESLASYGLK